MSSIVKLCPINPPVVLLSSTASSRTGNAIVGGWNIEDRESLLHMRGTNEARLNLDAGGRLNREGTRGERRAEESRKEAML